MALGTPIGKKQLVEYFREAVNYKPLPSLLDMIDYDERWPLYIHYDHTGVRFVPRDHFYLGPDTKRPSDCTWIVPGSTP